MMADQAQMTLLQQWAEAGKIGEWNGWRQTNLMVYIDLTGIVLRGADLHFADLRDADLSGADLSGANFTRADLRGATLKKAKLRRATLSHANTRNVLWDIPNYVRILPRGWVIFAALLVGALPFLGIVSSLWYLLRSDPLSGNHLQVLVATLLFPVELLLVWALVRLFLSIPFDVLLIIKIFIQRVGEREGCLGIFEAVMLFIVIAVDLGNPVPFMEVFDKVAVGSLTHADAVLVMKAKLAIGYIALLLVNLPLYATEIKYLHLPRL